MGHPVVLGEERRSRFLHFAAEWKCGLVGQCTRHRKSAMDGVRHPGEFRSYFNSAKLAWRNIRPEAMNNAT